MQRADGGWSGATRGAVCPSKKPRSPSKRSPVPRTVRTVERGAPWLVERVESGAWREPAPIGFYFAKLWYYERLYPLIWTVGALGKVARACSP